MTPTGTIAVMLTSQDQRHVGLSGAELFGDLGLRHRSTKRSDLGNLIFGQQFLVMGDGADIDGVLLVDPVIDPLKISGSGVGLNAVDVIDERKSGRVWNECECDETVDVERLAATVSVQTDLRVSDFVDARLENLAVASSQRKFVATNSVDASDSSKVADFVEMRKPVNADGEPIFMGNHEANFRAEMLAFSNAAPSAGQHSGGTRCL